ncbi:MAG: diphosphatase [Rhodospirillaceae bacterium]|jgi:NAD+ diphosphatase|nr:diphosphatase [Rhodospirillaceae bacterium]
MQQTNFYITAKLDRAGMRRRDAEWLASLLADPKSRVLPVWRGQNLIREADEPAAAWLPMAEVTSLLAEAGAIALLGLVEETAHFAVDLSHRGEPPQLPGARFTDLRNVGALMAREEGALLAYARGLMHWHLRHRFCGVCGSPTESREAGHLRLCSNPDCAAEHHPRTDPAVIMRIEHEGRVLLGRQTQWPQGMHSVLAGFVEPGESLEDAVRREVAEEAGIAITDIRYHSSQPWPFPASIMLGFTARAVDDRLAVNREELEDARWYHRDELLASAEDERFRLPRRDSIARRLIDDWLADRR